MDYNGRACCNSCQEFASLQLTWEQTGNIIRNDESEVI